MNVKNNNFDFFRFLFALFVVVSHSYALSGGTEAGVGVHWLTNGQLSFSQIGLSGFFTISGYFIFQSLQRSTTLSSYYKKRFLRLFPALFVVLVFSLLLAIIVYSSTLPFYKNTHVYTYLPFNLSLYGFQSSIQGVFDSNSYHSINGSLWTIRYEFSLYVGLSVLFYIQNYRKIILFLLCGFFLIFYVLYNFYLPTVAGVNFMNLEGLHVLNLGTFFIAGSILAAFELENIQHKKLVLIISSVLLLCALYWNYFDMIKHIVFPFFVLVLGFLPFPGIKDFGKWGDASYGIYIYSFPIQQTLVWFYKMNAVTLLFFSIPLSIAFGFLSWHLIEKKVLILKK